MRGVVELDHQLWVDRFRVTEDEVHTLRRDLVEMHLPVVRALPWRHQVGQAHLWEHIPARWGGGAEYGEEVALCVGE